MRKFVFALVALIVMNATMYGQDMQLVINDNNGNVAVFDISAGVVTPDTTGCLGPSGCALGNLYTPGAFDPHHGQLLVAGRIGQFTVTVTGQGGGFVTFPTLQNLNEIDATSIGPGRLTVTWTDTDYTNFGDAFSLAASGIYGAPVSNSTADFFVRMDPGNTIPAGVAVASLLDVGCTGSPCGVAETLPFVDNPTDSPTGSLTTIKDITFTGRGEVQLSFSIASAIPEPGSMLLLGTMLLGTGISLRRKFGR